MIKIPRLVFYNSEYRVQKEVTLTPKTTETLQKEGLQGLAKVLKAVKPKNKALATPARKASWRKFVDVMLTKGYVTQRSGRLGGLEKSMTSIVPTNEERRRAFASKYRGYKPLEMSRGEVGKTVEFLRTLTTTEVVRLPRPTVAGAAFVLWRTPRGREYWKDIRGRFAKSPEGWKYEP